MMKQKGCRLWRQWGLMLVLATVAFMVSPVFTDSYEDSINEMLIRTVKQFTARLYKGTSKQPGNLAMCPLAVQVALSLLERGADGNTRQEMRQALQLPYDPNTSDAVFKQLISEDGLKSTKHVQLYLTGAIFYAAGRKLNPNWEAKAKNTYGTDLQEIDFKRQIAAARRINQWVGKKTMGTIDKLVQPTDFTSNTKLLVVNAFYFKGKWFSQFSKLNTTRKQFYMNGSDRPRHSEIRAETISEQDMIIFEEAASAGESSEQEYVEGQQTRRPYNFYDPLNPLPRRTRQSVQTVEMMHQTGLFHYAIYDELDAKFLELPYADKHISMIVVLPNRDDGLRDLEDHIDQILAFDAMYSANVELALPKFKIEMTTHYNDVLNKLGMREAFTNQANFDNVIVNDQVAINDVVQKTFLEVTEEGTVAAAATAVGAITLSIPVSIPDVKFTADHPFMFILVDKRLQVPIFIGRYLGPNY